MANTRSNAMANLLAKPPTMNPAQLIGGRMRSKIVEVVLDNTEAAGHLMVLARFKKNDKIVSVKAAHPAIAGLTDLNVGLWTAVDWTLADGTAINADQYWDGVTFAVGKGGFHDYAGAAAVAGNARTAAEMDNLVWQDAGAASLEAARDEYDLVGQCVTDPGAAATVAFQIEYMAGD